MTVGSKLALAAVACAMGPLMAEGALLDGYEIETGYTLGTGVVVHNSSTTGVTQGSNSLEITTTGGWENAVQSNFGGSMIAAMDNLYDTTGSVVVMLDITAPAAAPGGWWQLNFAFQGTGVGWTQTPSNRIDTGAVLPTQTVQWDVTSIIAANQAGIGTSQTWGQFVLLTNGAGAPAGSRTFYADNLRVEAVPEPAVMGLLGLASSLGLMRRRRA